MLQSMGSQRVKHDLVTVPRPLSSTISQSLFNSCPLSQWWYLTVSPSDAPFSFFPASGSFPVNWLFASGGQGIRTSASVLSMNIQGWFPLGLTGLISLQSRQLLRVFSSTTIQKHQLFGAQPSLWFKSQIHVTTRKNDNFDYIDLYWQRDVSAF